MSLKIKIPDPLSIAIGLSFLVLIWAINYLHQSGNNWLESTNRILTMYQAGFWSLAEFTLQMTMILVLGYMLALSEGVKKFIFKLARSFDNPAFAIAVLAFTSLCMGWLNWGLGLIWGAVMARKMGQYAFQNKKPFNYGLAGAAGYSPLMFWHGGLSGSATLAVAKHGHFLESTIGIIPINETIFSSMNMAVTLSILVIIPLVFFLLAKKKTSIVGNYDFEETDTVDLSKRKFDKISVLFGLLLVIMGFLYFLHSYQNSGSLLTAIHINSVNFTLFTLAFVALRNISNFQQVAEKALPSATGIIIQFPLYAGIMAVISQSGLLAQFTESVIGISNAGRLPLVSYISAAIVNLFVPSGGGQWAVQGPIISQAAIALDSSIAKNIMALAYGDQLTNMLQPFWALPLLGITKLKAKEIVPYSALIMVVGGSIYFLALLLF